VIQSRGDNDNGSMGSKGLFGVDADGEQLL